MKEKIFYFDLETTGVNFWQHGIHQIGIVIEIDGEVIESHNLNVRPHPKAKIEEEALKVAGVTLEQIMEYPEMSIVYRELIEILSRFVDKYNKKDKFFLCGFNNASFDNQFLKAFWVQNNDNYFFSWFWSSPLDVIVLAAEFMKARRHEMENFKLMTVAEALNIDINKDQAHDAEYDIMVTREIYHIVTGRKAIRK